MLRSIRKWSAVVAVVAVVSLVASAAVAGSYVGVAIAGDLQVGDKSLRAGAYKIVVKADGDSHRVTFRLRGSAVVSAAADWVPLDAVQDTHRVVVEKDEYGKSRIVELRLRGEKRALRLR